MNATPKASNLEKFQNAITRYIAEVGGNPRLIMRKQFAKLLDRVTKLTPPKTKAEGRRIVKRDIERAVQPIKPDTFKDKAVSKMVRKKDYEGLHDFAQRVSSGRWDIVPFTPELHLQARNSRGRVRSGQGLLTPDTVALREYVKKEQEHSGMAKGGWAKGLQALGASIPSWIAQWLRAGEFEDHLMDPVLAYAKSDNESPWASRGDDQYLIQNALGSRARDILYSIEKVIERAGKKLS